MSNYWTLWGSSFKCICNDFVQAAVCQAYFIKRLLYQSLRLILRSKGSNDMRQKYFLSFFSYFFSSPQHFSCQGKMLQQLKLISLNLFFYIMSSFLLFVEQIYLRFLDYEMANSNECKRNFVAVYDGGRWDFMNTF